MYMPQYALSRLLDKRLQNQNTFLLFFFFNRSLQDLLDYDQPDLQNVFCLNFEISRNVYGEVKVHELKPGGSKIAVTLENKYVYVIFIKCLC